MFVWSLSVFSIILMFGDYVVLVEYIFCVLVGIFCFESRMSKHNIRVCYFWSGSTCTSVVHNR